MDRLLAGVLGWGIKAGRLDVTFDDGTRVAMEGDEPGPRAAIRVHKPGLMRAIALGGSNALTEAYMAGDLDTDDLANFLTVAALNQHRWAVAHPRLYSAGRTLAARMPARLTEVAVDTMADHYNLGNEFYAAWLDPTMTYSSGKFERADSTLEEAQRTKYAAMAHLADLRPGQRVLEIGSGWGGFALYAAALGCHVTTLTIADRQAEHVSVLAERHGLDSLIDVQLRDFMDVTETYDRVVSIEMIESIDERRWPEYFAAIAAVLAPGGRAGLQAIVIDDDAYDAYRTNEDFIRRYIFPGGMLPSPDLLRRLSSAAGLTWVADEAFGADYAKTLALWHERFDDAWPDLVHLGFDERFRRMWKTYFAYCEAGFSVGRIDVMQLALEAPARPGA